MDKSILTGAGLAILALLGVIFAGKIFEENQAGFIQVKQAFPSGELSVITDPGYFCQCFGTLTEYKHAGTYAFSDNASESGGGTDDASLVGNSIPVRFSDGGQAKIAGSARFDVPVDNPGLLKIHNKFRSYSSIANGLLKPAIREAVVLSAALMTAEESYSGGKAQLSEYALDQLQNGVYLTESEEVETKDPITGKSKTVRVVQIRTKANGTPLRKPNTLDQYGIEVTQLFFPDDFNYEDGIRDQISKVRDAQMKATAAFAEAEAAAQDEKTAEAKGRANVAQAKAAAEVEKQKAVTAAEQARDVAVLAAESRKRVADEDKQAAGFEKQANILRGEGEAARKKLVYAADGALAQRLDAFVKSQEAWAKAHAERAVPTTVFGGGFGNADTVSLQDLMTMQLAKQLGLNPAPGKN
jgi:regulator of protease activity HflC (stomatin/prohibitin superfamily)